jgi:hypothetical protein
VQETIQQSDARRASEKRGVERGASAKRVVATAARRLLGMRSERVGAWRSKWHPSVDKIHLTLSKEKQLCLWSILAMFYGFQRLSSLDSGVPCEMVVYFVFYRIALTCGVWGPFVTNEVFSLAALLFRIRAIRSPSEARVAPASNGSQPVDPAACPAVARTASTYEHVESPSGDGRAARVDHSGERTPRPLIDSLGAAGTDDGANGVRSKVPSPPQPSPPQPSPPQPSPPSKGAIAWSLVARHAMRTSGHFLRLLFCAAVMNTAFWFACISFFGTPFRVALEAYWWGFVKDIFGVCAASGYKDSFGFDCLS